MSSAVLLLLALPAADAAPDPDFTLIALPDTQMYTAQANGGTLAMFTSQTEWIVSNCLASNIVYVTLEGDISNDGDTPGCEYEWQNATNALYRLGDPVRTGLADGVPFGAVVGNHDLMGGGALVWFNKYLGTNYFQGRGYYGGHYGADNANHYDLFSAGGMDFIALSLEMAAGSDSNIMAWANAVLQANAGRRAIVTTHSLIGPAVWPTPGSWTAEGPAIFNGLTNNPNLFLMLCGHMHGEGRRHELVGGHYVDLLLADWQTAGSGGGGYLRILQFSPGSNQIHVSSYSPYADLYRTGADSQFTLDYPMESALQTRIVSLSAGGLLTWTNAGTNTSCGVEYKRNLDHTWIPLGPDAAWWNIHPTGALYTVDLGLGNFQTLAPFAGLDFDFNTFFFHVVSSFGDLPGKAIVNNIRLVNVSTSDLTDVTIGEYRGQTTYWTNNFPVLPPGTGTEYSALAEVYPQSSVQLPEATGPMTWFAQYTHEGVPRHIEQSVWIWGPSNMDITVSASNGCSLVRYEWLDLETTTPY